MPHPFFGAKDVCYIEKKGPNKKLFLARRACTCRSIFISITFELGASHTLIILRHDVFVYEVSKSYFKFIHLLDYNLIPNTCARLSFSLICRELMLAIELYGVVRAASKAKVEPRCVEPGQQ